MKCTKQVIEEKLGTTSPTRDPEMEGKIDEVKFVDCFTSIFPLFILSLNKFIFK